MAKQLLCETRQTIKEIAWQCGFMRHAGFCRSFNLEFRCSPSRYRENYKAGISQKQFCWQIPLREDDFMHLLNLAYQKPWLMLLLKVVILNISNKIFTVGQLAAAVYLTPSSLNRRVKELFEVSPQRFIRDLRLQYASELLVAKSASIAEIAYRTGFFDPAHLSRCFKAAFGCQPKVYIESSSQRSIHWLEEKLMNQNGK
jgi:AraC-like DNA-binding protein